METKNITDPWDGTNVDQPRGARVISEYKTEPIPRVAPVKSCCDTSSPQPSHRSSANTSSFEWHQGIGLKPTQRGSTEDEEFMEQKIMQFIRAKNLYLKPYKKPALAAAIGFLASILLMVIMMIFIIGEVQKMSHSHWYHVQNSVTGLGFGIIL
jgi:hypothetical protein